MAQSWTTEEITYVTSQLHQPVYSITNITNGLRELYGVNRTYDSVQKKVRQVRLAQDIQEIIANQDLVQEEPEEILPDQTFDRFAGVEHRQSQELLQPRYGRAFTEQEILSWVEQVNSLTRYQVPITPLPLDPGKSTLVIHLSDLHMGKRTDCFNQEIATERLIGIPNRLVNETMIPVSCIDEIIVNLGGDGIEGEDIFPTQNGTVESPAIIQTKLLTQALWNMLLNFRRVYPNARVVVKNAPGNHGRTSKSANVITNWDNVVAQTLEMLASIHADPMLIVHANLDWINVYRVKDKNFMSYHYGVKHTGTPAMQTKIAGWILSKNIDVLLKGHHHKWEIGTFMGRIIVANGSLCGPDDYSEQLAVDEPARQAYFFVTPGKPLYGFGFLEWN